ncbi:HNH endonuclease [Klosneuvirus KNV1]|uniref:HNH endonuclease n=1 Tax=Klosneuvirus KNV1 TaxID=1977640 RepID=A0A1V0SJK4_9VIRU|nr:HNH endonuclease [Klosneuvirus KNV1]
MNPEIWKDIEGYEEKYQVSNEGNVLTLDNNKILAKRLIGPNHYVRLSNDGKRHEFNVGELVATAFVINDDKENKKYIKHIDDNKLNNNSNNLEWVKNIVTIDPNKKLIFQYDTNGNLIKTWNNFREILDQNIKYNRKVIISCIGERCNSAYGYIWRYEDHTDDVKPKEKILDNTNLLQKDDYEFDKNIEHWKDIFGCEDKYRISSFGRVKSLINDVILEQIISGGYYMVSIKNNQGIKISVRISILVAKHFIIKPITNDKLIVDHSNNDKLNNHVDNLRWLTYSENTRSYIDNFKPKKKIIQYDMDNNVINEWDSVDKLLESNKQYRRKQIQSCCQNKIKTSYGYIWKYENNNIVEEIKLEKDEIFKSIGILNNCDFSQYEVSNYGKVTSNHTKSGYLKSSINTNGYPKVMLIDKNTNEQYNINIHIIVAELFIDGKTDIKNVVNHIDENKTNNYYKNLEWVTTRENVIHSKGVKINQIDPETDEIINTFKSATHAAEYVGCDTGTIIRVCKGKRNHCRGYKWQYAE